MGRNRLDLAGARAAAGYIRPDHAKSQLSRRDIPFFIVNAIDGDDAPDSEKEGGAEVPSIDRSGCCESAIQVLQHGLVQVVGAPYRYRKDGPPSIGTALSTWPPAAANAPMGPPPVLRPTATAIRERMREKRKRKKRRKRDAIRFAKLPRVPKLPPAKLTASGGAAAASRVQSRRALVKSPALPVISDAPAGLFGPLPVRCGNDGGMRF